jgi:hypothetical protein
MKFRSVESAKIGASATVVASRSAFEIVAYMFGASLEKDGVTGSTYLDDKTQRAWLEYRLAAGEQDAV